MSMMVVGYTTREHLLLDLDDTDLYKAIQLTKMVIHEWREVGSALILYTSTCSCRRWLYNPFYKHLRLSRRRQNFHVVFDNNIGYEKCCTIIETLVALDALDRAYAEIRQFRGDMTLRVSAKPLSTGPTPPPRPFIYVLNRHAPQHDGQIMRYLAFRRLVLASGRSSRPQKTRPSRLRLCYLRLRNLSKSAARRLHPRSNRR